MCVCVCVCVYNETFGGNTKGRDYYKLDIIVLVMTSGEHLPKKEALHISSIASCYLWALTIRMSHLDKEIKTYRVSKHTKYIDRMVKSIVFILGISKDYRAGSHKTYFVWSALFFFSN